MIIHLNNNNGILMVIANKEEYETYFYAILTGLPDTCFYNC